jgi:hypothetical protein
VNGSFGDDYFASDDTAGEVTLNGEFGKDIFQIGQMFKSNRGDQTDLVPSPGGNDFSDVTGVHVDDAFANIETTRGWLSNGISAPMTINGWPAMTLHGVPTRPSQLNGEGDDTFEIRAALAGSQEPQRSALTSRGAARPAIRRHAPVNTTAVTVRHRGRDRHEFGDDLRLPRRRGAGLTNRRIESLRGPCRGQRLLLRAQHQREVHDRDLRRTGRGHV